jgi:hypothetical protein|tara:strand:- start:160 stop:369 length:210 start_codon:yes stop_codon:yes gene_type:complete
VLANDSLCVEVNLGIAIGHEGQVHDGTKTMLIGNVQLLSDEHLASGTFCLRAEEETDRISITSKSCDSI